MSCIILNPVDTINANGSICTRMRTRFGNYMSMYGTTTVRLRLTETKNALGSITDISSVYVSMKLFIFDRYKSNVLSLQGINVSNEGVGGSDSPRAYSQYNNDICEGDFILVNFDSEDESYSEKYRVLKVEAHELDTCVVFNTLYLIREHE